ncbi:MAG: WG repeat-containing protein, partial [Bacteroidota bacterium]
MTHCFPFKLVCGWVGIFCLLLILSPVQTLAQTNCEDATQIIRLAERDLSNRTYERAINRLLDARDICPAKKTQINALIKKAFQQIEGEKRSAKQAQQQAEQERIIALAARQKADSTLRIANRVLDKLYFFAGRFGLTIKDIREGYGAPLYRYGFINRKGKVVIPFAFEEATPFSLVDGFARVVFEGEKYLLDTLGQIYRSAERLADLGPETEALDLMKQGAYQLSDSLAKYQRLKVLLLPRRGMSHFREFPMAICQLDSLRYLDISGQYLQRLPEEFG